MHRSGSRSPRRFSAATPAAWTTISVVPTLPERFDAREVDAAVTRLLAPTPDRELHWGQMTVGQMLAHCRVAYAMALRDDFPRPAA